jgi:hypothetical protein
MAHLKNNPMMSTASGLVGDTFVFRQVRGKLVVANRPTRGRTATAKQMDIQNRFTSASNYAKGAMANPALKEQYAKGVGGNLYTPRLVALSDYLNAPDIQNIDVSEYKGVIGNPVTIKAQDDFLVTRVRVVVLAGGAVVETGDAVQDPIVNLQWRYTATAAAAPGSITLQITAFDTAGNQTTQEKSV